MRTLLIILTAGLLLAGADQTSATTATFVSTPNLAIPDAGGVVTSTMVVNLPRYTTAIRVYMRLTTQASSDLRIWVESPYGPGSS